MSCDNSRNTQERKIRTGATFCQASLSPRASRGFQVTWFSTSSVRIVRRSATIKPPIAFVARHCLAAGKWRESKNPQEISLPREVSQRIRASHVISTDHWIAEDDPERTIHSRGITWEGKRREWQLCSDQSQSSVFNDSALFRIDRVRLIKYIHITCGACVFGEISRNCEKLYGNCWI